MAEIDVEALRGAIGTARIAARVRDEANEALRRYNTESAVRHAWRPDVLAQRAGLEKRSETCQERWDAAALALLPLLDGLPERIAAWQQVVEAARSVSRLWDEDVDDAGPALTRLIAALDNPNLPAGAPALRTPDGWLATPEFAYIEVIDRDGWREEGADWYRPIPRAEFEARLARCTIMENAHLPTDAVERDAP